jgi:glycosyltransferase involved in cell wall biosynthesis
MHNRYIGYAGRLSKEKGIDLILAAAENLPHINFKLAGQGLSINDKPKNVELVGQLSKNELSRFYLGAEFMLFPSTCYEGFPGSILESMWHSKCVIASNIGGIPEIIDHEINGILFNAGDSDHLTRHIASLWINREKCMALGRAARLKAIEQYTNEIYYKRLMNVYSEAIKHSRKHIN